VLLAGKPRTRGQQDELPKNAHDWARRLQFVIALQ
jgi:hypothetical protein